MKKHTLTPAEQARRDERKEKFAALIKRVAEMSAEAKATLAASMPGVVNCDGHALSMRNTLLIALQIGSSATIVGGFRQWIKQGRVVRKGEHGASILVPCTPKKDENKQEGEESNSRTFFTSGTVFDISQTQAIEVSGEEAA